MYVLAYRKTESVKTICNRYECGGALRILKTEKKEKQYAICDSAHPSVHIEMKIGEKRYAKTYEESHRIRPQLR